MLSALPFYVARFPRYSFKTSEKLFNKVSYEGPVANFFFFFLFFFFNERVFRWFFKLPFPNPFVTIGKKFQ